MLRIGLQFAERDTAVLVVGRHLLPLFHLGDACCCHCLLSIRYCLPCSHIANLDERHRNQAWAAEPGDGFRNEPLWVRLCDDDDGLALLCIQLVWSFCLEVVHDDSIHHSTRLPRLRHAHLLAHHVLHHAGGIGRVGAAYPSQGLLVARVVRLILRGRAGGRTATVAHCLPYALKVRDGDKSAGAVQRVAGLVPVTVVFATDDVQEVALGEAEIVGVWARVGGLVVVEGFYDL